MACLNVFGGQSGPFLLLKFFTKYEGAVYGGSQLKNTEIAMNFKLQIHLIDAIFFKPRNNCKAPFQLSKLVQVKVLRKNGKTCVHKSGNTAVCFLHAITFVFMNM